MDGSHRRPTIDVELNLPAQISGQLLADVADHSRLVGAPRAAPRKYQRQPGAITATNRAGGDAHDDDIKSRAFEGIRRRGRLSSQALGRSFSTIPGPTPWPVPRDSRSWMVGPPNTFLVFGA